MVSYSMKYFPFTIPKPLAQSVPDTGLEFMVLGESKRKGQFCTSETEREAAAAGIVTSAKMSGSTLEAAITGVTGR